jgi:methylenetetrahydrofolate--tRNA-(uracil-5-)-methyltransferase
MIGALLDYISGGPADNFQPMNANLGLLPPIEPHIRNKSERHAALIARGLSAAAEFARGIGRGKDIDVGVPAVAGRQ